MDSFILRFKTHVPWGALRLLVAAGAAFLASLAYLYYGNPEIRLYKKAIEIKQAWAHKLTLEYGNKTVIYGGSSCAFSIDGERLLEKHQTPTVNMGLHVGLMPTMLTNCALSETRPGDTLIVAIEPYLLTYPLDAPPPAVKLSYAVHSATWLEAAWLEHPVSKASSLSALRPSSTNVIVMLAKVIMGLPLYRYVPSDIHPSGWMTTAERSFFDIGEKGENESGLRLSYEGENLLRWLRDWSVAHQIRLAYSLPWMYVALQDVAPSQRRNLSFLQQVSQYLPVLKDPWLGTCSSREYFADSFYHLTPEGAALRTDSLAQQLKSWNVWTVKELKDFVPTPAEYNAKPPHQ